MDIDLLRTFLEVNRTRHFGRAAENLFLSQSAISARIRLLEDSVGAPVFTRSRNDIQLTLTGRRLLKHAESIVTAWNRARQEVTLAENMEHSIVIGGSPSIWDILLQDWLHRVYKAMPELSLISEAENQGVLLRRLLDGTLDLAFSFEGPQIVELEVKEIASVPLILVSNQKDINAEQALLKNYLLVDWGTSFLTNHAKHYKDYPRPRIQLGLGRIALEFIKTIGGSAYLAEPMIKKDLKNKKLYKVKDAPIIERSIFAVYQDQGDNRNIIENILALMD